jgi:hypothetical protein
MLAACGPHGTARQAGRPRRTACRAPAIAQTPQQIVQTVGICSKTVARRTSRTASPEPRGHSPGRQGVTDPLWSGAVRGRPSRRPPPSPPLAHPPKADFPLPMLGYALHTIRWGQWPQWRCLSRGYCRLPDASPSCRSWGGGVASLLLLSVGLAPANDGRTMAGRTRARESVGTGALRSPPEADGAGRARDRCRTSPAEGGAGARAVATPHLAATTRCVPCIAMHAEGAHSPG